MQSTMRYFWEYDLCQNTSGTSHNWENHIGELFCQLKEDPERFFHDFNYDVDDIPLSSLPFPAMFSRIL